MQQTKLNEKKTLSAVILPFKVLISPSKAFNEIAQNPSFKGLFPLSALILVVIAATLYAFASKIVLNINGPTSLLATDFFPSWYTNVFVSTLVYIILYWSVFASSLALLSKMLGGKETSWRAVLVVLASLLSVFIILYAVRALMYLALPSIYFTDNSSWPPVSQSPEESAAFALFSQSWSSLSVYQFLNFFPWFALAWLVALGAMAIRALREVSWTRATIVSVICFAIALILFGLP